MTVEERERQARADLVGHFPSCRDCRSGQGYQGMCADACKLYSRYIAAYAAKMNVDAGRAPNFREEHLSQKGPET